MIRRTCCALALGLAAMAAVPTVSFAQERQGRGDFDPARFREEMMNRMKEQLAPKDDAEWTVLQPKIEKVMTVQRESMTSRFSGFGGRGGSGDRGSDRGNRGGDQPRSAASQAGRDLRDALENKDTPTEQIVAKLKSLRDARAKAKADLEAAQKELQEVLTPRQEAVMVSMGMLE